MNILGINAFHGDASAALVKNGILIAAIEEERLNRKKHCAGFPTLSVQAVAAQTGTRPVEIAHVAISRDPKANLHRKILYALTKRPSLLRLVKDRLAGTGEGRGTEKAGAPGLGLEPGA